MKKTLLLALSLAVTAVYAQKAQEGLQMNAKMQMPNRMAPAAQMVTANTAVKKAAKKADAEVLAFAKPEGSMYIHWNKEGRGYGQSIVIVSPWEEFVYKNLSTNPEATIWKMQNPNTGDFLDYNQYRNEDYSYSYALDPGYYSLTPFLFNETETDTFAIAKASNYYWADDDSYVTMIWTDSISSKGFLDDHQSVYGWGSMDNGYLYGSGTLTHDQLGVGTCWALRQEFPKPMSPLYVEDIYLSIKSQTKQPLANDVELTLYVVDTLTNAPLAIMKATKDNIVDLGADYAGTSSYAKLTGEFQTYRLTFSQVETDEFGYEYNVPIVIKDAFYLQLEGLEQEGVEFGLNCLVINPEDADMTEGLFLVEYGEGDTRAHYYSECAVPFTFTSMFDKVVVITSNSEEDDDGNELNYEDMNYLYVSNDATQQGVPAGEESYFPGVYVQTALPWFDEEGNDNYYESEDLPSWISRLVVDDSYYNDYGYCIVNVEAEPLPAEMKGRAAKIYLMGHGFVAEDPIYVIQGEVSEEELGIADVKTQKDAVMKGTFNLAGQKVAKANGIVIANGKKVIVK